MSQSGDVYRVPQFLQARTRDDLVRAMLLNNLAHGMEFDYFGIQKDGREWIVWFRWPIDKKQFLIERVKNEQTGQPTR